MKKLSFLVSRWFLVFVALVVVGLVIWFLGPFFAFGGLKPLASIGMRVLVIALLLVGVLLWLKGRSTSVVFAALLCLLVWYAGPLLSFGRVEPLASVPARVVAITVVLLIFAAFGLYWLWQKMRSDDAFLEKALRFGEKKSASPAAGRLREVEARIDATLARLKSLRTGARGLARLFQGTRYLYELPWFIAIGSTSSGKTSVLLNAGLTFAAGAATPRTGAASVGTKNVDWWLSNDAVLIDTAGYYTRHGASTQPLTQPFLTPVDKRTDGDDTDNTTAKNTDRDTASPPDEADLRRLIDEDEWHGFLNLLRRHRPRAPINGAVLAISVDVLSSPDPAIRAAEAGALRERLADLRTRLGIRFPVYLLITQMDRLPGFADYFASLTEEHRAQLWGFTLPVNADPAAQHDLATVCHDELTQLATRVASGINTRLEDEYDLGRRRRLAALPEAFAALSTPLEELLAQLFVDSRYDDTQHHATLRGLYFTSARQGGEPVVAEPLTVVQRLMTGRGHPLATSLAQPTANHSYFLRDLFARVIVPEAHLVRPNLRWEYRFRLLRLVGHTLGVVLFVWLAMGIRVSFGNNSGYLDAIAHKTQALAAKVAQLYREPKADAVPDTLGDAHSLPSFTGLDLSAPDSRFRYGLYSAPGVVDASRETYRALEDTLLLPSIVHRMEDVIAQSAANRDAKATYDALRVYLMLYDNAKFNATDIKAWVLEDWAKNDSASIFGGRASMIGHIELLFSGERIVRSPLIRNDALIQQARAFLDGSNATQRLYDRAKADMQKEAPDEFTLLRAIGPQAGTVFTRASGAPLSRGVPGLFTFDGYRNLFDKRLPEFVQQARDDDAWVMGRSYLGEAQKKTAEIVGTITGTDDPLTAAIRRLYLTEYAQQWDVFLGDVRTVAGTSLAFDLQVLRQIAAPDSPLTRLARAAVRETTLTQSIAAANGSLLQKTGDQLSQKADQALGIRAEERIERELVDSHFAALREMVTGSADTSASNPPPNAQAGKTGLDGVTSLLDDYYTALTVADNAIANNSMPPLSDAAAKLKMAANTMPAPFREVLLGLSVQGSHEVNQGIGQLLSRQMQAVVSDTCRVTIEGNYPFAPDSARDVGVDDLTRVFAQGGVIDDFFVKNLAPFVDTSAKPWRYRTLPGATEPVQGPELEPFQHARQIRDMFFGDQGKQLLWKTEIRVPELDPTVTTLAIDIDGQSMLYQHGPVAPLAVNWPGPRGGVHAEITASPRIRPETSTLATDGPWALMRLLRKGRVVPTATPGRTRVEFEFDGRKAVLDLASAGSVANPLTSDVLTTFRCPSSMPMLSLPDSGPPPGLPTAAMAAAVTSASRSTNTLAP
ncbi:type VI secretion system membrane subunit TssM [Paraburkholderia xenovorans]|uniref:type VI secretion system membrane subunit TssM n=1 Tax=Paraburkholderia xenovorans TaxID=36873 RepID=UPI0038BD91AF